MNIIDFLEQLSSCAPNEPRFDELVKLQPKNIQDAVKNNDTAFIKKCISNASFYANDCTVTVF